MEIRDKKQKTKIAFVIVLYQTPKSEIKRLENEISTFGFYDYKIYFIDNTKNNRGYAKAVNLGISRAKKANPDIFVVANPDISFSQLKGEDLLKGGDFFDIWGFSLKQQEKIYYGGFIESASLSGWLSQTKPKKRFKAVDWVSGSLMFIKKEVVEKIGGFDERFFLYYEDVDYCKRASVAGFRVGIDSQIIYHHFEASAKNYQKNQLLAESHRKFLEKYGGWRQKLRYSLKNIADTRKPGADKKIYWRFFINFFSLNASSLINKLIHFLLFILLIRYLTPEQYGIYSLVWAQISLFSPLVDLGTTSYGIVYLPTEKKEKLNSLYNLRIFTSLMVFFLTISAGFALFYSKTAIAAYIFLTSFVIFSNMFSGTYLIQNAAFGNIYYSSILSLGFNIILVLAMIAVLLLQRSLTAIFLTVFIFYNLYSLVNAILLKKNLKNYRLTIDKKKWIAFLKKSYIFVIIGFFAGLYFKLDIFLLSFLKGEREVGIYSAGYKFLDALGFLAASYNVSATPIFARLAKTDFSRLLGKIKMDILLLIMIGGVIAFGTYIFSPLVLPIFLKGRYILAIPVLKVIIFALPLILVSSVFLNVFYVLEYPQLVALIFTIQSLVNFVLNYLFIPSFSYMASSYITVISEIFNLLAILLAFYIICHRRKIL